MFGAIIGAALSLAGGAYDAYSQKKAAKRAARRARRQRYDASARAFDSYRASFQNGDALFTDKRDPKDKASASALGFGSGFKQTLARQQLDKIAAQGTSPSPASMPAGSQVSSTQPLFTTANSKNLSPKAALHAAQRSHLASANPFSAAQYTAATTQKTGG